MTTLSQIAIIAGVFIAGWRFGNYGIYLIQDAWWVLSQRKAGERREDALVRAEAPRFRPRLEPVRISVGREISAWMFLIVSVFGIYAVCHQMWRLMSHDDYAQVKIITQQVACAVCESGDARHDHTADP